MQPIEWKISEGLTDYETALAAMEARVEDILAGRAGELIWLVEHPPLYTAGTSAKNTDLLSKQFPVYQAGRGGEYTYHGPGQRVVYVMLNLKARGVMDVRRYVASLEQWIIATLASFGIEGFTREGRVGVWVNQMTDDRLRMTEKNNPSSSNFGEAKIAAIGIRIRKWVTYHGICINVNPDLSHYSGIVPCGIREFGVSSLEKLGVKATMHDLDTALKKQSNIILGTI